MSKKPSTDDFPANVIGFAEDFEDGSGVQYLVRYDYTEDPENVEIRNNENAVNWPLEKISWLIAALERIGRETDE